MNKKIKSSAVDRISELPDDIIANIISRLTLKQAAATSSISTRWTDLWKLYSGCFDLDGSTFVHDLRTQSMQTDKFVDWVNHVLRSHQGATMKRLRIKFDRKIELSAQVFDSWVQVALVKRVQCIELDLCNSYPHSEALKSFAFLIRSNCGFRSLKTLFLKQVDVRVSGDDFLSILDNCPNLEELKVFRFVVQGVVKLSSLSLKDLTLWLLSPDARSTLVLEDVPQLKYVNLHNYGCHIQIHHSQLQELVLDSPLPFDGHGNEENNNVSELFNLKHLRMRYRLLTNHNFSHIVAYLKAAPLLENFTIELLRYGRDDAELNEASMLNMMKNHCYKNLKTLKFNGFTGVTNEVMFIRYLLNHAPLLEKIIIDPCRTNYLGTPSEVVCRSTLCLEARDRAIKLSASLPCHVTIV